MRSPGIFLSFQYKYQLNIDGTVAAYRFPYLMAGGSLILKQESNYYEHFYNQLKPYEHFIPLKPDLSDVVEKIRWAKDHDEEVRLSLFYIFFIFLFYYFISLYLYFPLHFIFLGRSYLYWFTS